MQNIMSEMLYAKYRNIVLDIETLCGTSCLKYRWYAQNTEMLIYSMLKSKYIRSLIPRPGNEASIFVHVAI